MSSKVAKKNLFMRFRIKFCLIRTMIMDKIERLNIGGKGNKSTSGYRMKYEILCYNTDDDIRFIK